MTETLLTTQNLIYYTATLLITILSVVLTVGQYCLHLRIARTGKLHLIELFYPVRYDANRLIIAESILFAIKLIGLAPIIGAFAILYFYNTVGNYKFCYQFSIQIQFFCII